MSEHLTSKELSRYASENVASRDKKRIDDHLAECGVCSSALEVILKSGSYKEIKPSPELRQKVLHSHSMLAETEKIREWRIATLRQAAAVLLICAIIPLLIYSGYKYFAAVPGQPVYFSFSGEGEFSHSSEDPDGKITDGSKINTENGKGLLAIQEVCSIRILEKTGFEIKKAFRKKDKLVLSFLIPEGRIISDFYDNISIYYSFETPRAVISSTGTELYINVTGEQTVLIVKSGKAEISYPDDPETVTALSGNKYTITDKITTSDIREDTYKKFRSPEMKDTKTDFPGPEKSDKKTPEERKPDSPTDYNKMRDQRDEKRSIRESKTDMREGRPRIDRNTRGR